MRQFGCIELDKASALNLRELIKPEDLGRAGPIKLLALSIYEALLVMALNGLDEINVELSDDECVYLNTLVKNKHWSSADAILLQSWQVIHERRFGSPYRPQLKEGDNAIHSEAGSGDRANAPANGWRA